MIRAASGAYSAAAAGAALLFSAGGILLAVTLPYSDWDSFAFGNWSLAIAHGGTLDPLSAGLTGSARPLFYALQGGLWAITGVSFSAGRLLSLAFGLLLIGAIWSLARRSAQMRIAPPIAVLLVLSISSLPAETLAGKTDVPASAAVAAVAALALRRTSTRAANVALTAAGFLAMLTKPNVLAPLLGLAVFLAFAARRPNRALPAALVGAGALAAGLVAGLAYDLVMAIRFHESLVGYLRAPESGIFAQQAASARWNGVLDAGLLGPGLRLPLIFSLVYAVLRVARCRHCASTVAALAVGLIWGSLGPILADSTDGSFSTAEGAFVFLGLAGVLSANLVVRDEDAPTQIQLWLAVALAVPSLVVWDYGTAFVPRLASIAWPGVVLMITLPLATAVHRLLKISPTFGLLPLPFLLAAVWISLSGFNGLHGHQWVEYRSLGWSGIRDRTRTENIVLPSVQEALALAVPALGSGRLVTSDPRFAYFLPGRVDTAVPLRCQDVGNHRVFILLTSDESERQAQADGGLATPEQWAACVRPRLEALAPPGDSGFEIFRIRR